VLAVCYVALQRVLQLVCLRFRSTAFKDLEIVVLRHNSRSFAGRFRAGVSSSRPNVFGSGEPDVAEGGLVGVCRHAGDASPLAPASGGEPLDVHAPRRPSANQRRGSSTDRPVGTRKSTMGLRPHRGRAEGLGRACVSHHL